MAITPLKKLVDTALTKKKINADDARAILREVEKDNKFTTAEATQLKRLTQLPSSRFQRNDEFIPNPYDSEDGITIKTDPKAWLKSEVEMTEAKLKVTSSVPGVTVTLGKIKKFTEEDFGDYFRRELSVSVTGKTVARNGTIEFSYGSRNISVEVKAGDTLSRVVGRLTSAITRKEGGSTQYHGFIDDKKSGKQTVTFEVL